MVAASAAAAGALPVVTASTSTDPWTPMTLDPLFLRVATRRPAHLRTGDLAIGQEIDVVVSVTEDRSVHARVVWRSEEWFLAVSGSAVHRGRVGDRSKGKGPAFCEQGAWDLKRLAEALAFAERELLASSPAAT